MFGRKKVKPQPQPAPRSVPADMSPEEMDRRTDDAIGVLSEALGINLDFDIGSIFAPCLWDDPEIGALLRKVGLEPNMAGNKMSLLKDERSLRTLLQRPKDDPVREALASSGFGMVLFNPAAANGYADGLVTMQREKLREFAQRTDLSDEAREYAVWDLMRFTSEVMKGNVPLG